MQREVKVLVNAASPSSAICRIGTSKVKQVLHVERADSELRKLSTMLEAAPVRVSVTTTATRETKLSSPMNKQALCLRDLAVLLACCCFEGWWCSDESVEVADSLANLVKRGVLSPAGGGVGVPLLLLFTIDPSCL